MLTVASTTTVPFVHAKLVTPATHLHDAMCYRVSLLLLQYTKTSIYILFYSTSAPQQDVPAIINPCVPSPCGPRSQCQAINNVPSCSCLTDSFGSPPNCRPECTINSDCTSNKACINEKCKDPCPGACGFEARCNVINHTPTCTCNEGYIGDSFSSCHLKPPPRMNKRKPFIFLNSVTY